MYTIVIGNPWDGMTLRGMFLNFDDAEANAYYFYDCQEWYIRELEPIA